MADNFNVNRGLDSKIKLQPINPGSIWIAEDGQYLCLDSKDGLKRIQITDVIDLSVESPQSYFPNKIYIDGYKLKKYNVSTGNLETISDLESEVLESENEFIYDSSDASKATLADNSSPKNGTIVIDKNGDVGIVTSSTSTTLTISIIANNKSKNVLTGYDIYFDSNYDGNQVGTIEYPFNSWSELYSKCETLLTGTSLTTIHIKSNSILKINVIPENIKNVIFTSDSAASIYFYKKKDVVNWNNVTFNNINTSTYVDGDFELMDYVSINFVKCNYIYFKSCNLHATCLKNCKYIYFNDCNKTYAIEIYEESKDVYINNTNINNLSVVNSSGLIQVINSYINTLDTFSKIISEIPNVDTLRIINSIIINSINIEGINNITLIGGGMINGTDCQITANNINLSTFDLNGVTPTLTGNVNKLSGLSSDQVYDKNNNRPYGIPNDSTLKAHLDKIGESIGALNNKLAGTDSLVNAFITKDTFTTKDELSGTFKIGDVMTYVSESSQNLQFNHELIGNNYESKLEYDYTSMNYKGAVNLYSDLPLNAEENDVYSVTYNDDYTNSGEHYIFDGENWNVVDKIEYWYYMFTLENASYFAKYNDNVNLISYSNFSEQYEIAFDESLCVTGKVYSVLDDIITVKLRPEDLIKQIKENIIKVSDNTIDETQAETIAIEIINTYLNKTMENAIFEQVIKVSYKDRLIKLSNGWDKLSGSTDNAAGNYHIVSTYTALSNIENDATRKVGTLAYVEDEDIVYKWVVIDPVTNQKDWVEFSSGSGGSGSIITEMQYCDPNDEENEYYSFNFQKLKYPTIYYNDENSITIQCYVNTAQSGPINATLTCKPASGSIGEYQILTQQLVKRTNYIEIPKDKLFDGSAFYYLSIQDMYGYSFYICDKDGNSLTNKLTYYVSSGSFKLTTTFDDSLVYSVNKAIDVSYNLTLSETYSYKNLGLDIYTEDTNTFITRLPINDNNVLSGGKSGTYTFIPSEVTDENGNQLLTNGEYKLILNADLYNSATNEEIHPEVILYLVLMESNKIVINDLTLLSNEIYTSNFTSISYEFITTYNSDLYDIYYKFSDSEITEIGDIDTWTVIKNVQPTSNRTVITNTIHTPEIAGDYYLAIVCKLETGLSSNISNNVFTNILSPKEQDCVPITTALTLSFDTQNNLGTNDVWQSKYIDGTVTNTTGHTMKLYNTVNVHKANGWNNYEYDGGTEGTTSSDYDLEPNNVLSSSGYYYLKLFGDSYGIVLNADGTEYSAFSNTLTDGFTVECCFRANYPGNLDATVLKIDGTNGIEIKPDSIRGWYNGEGNSIEKSLVEDSWTHVVFTVNPQTTGSEVSDYTKQVPMKHAAIYINGVLAKAAGISTDSILTNATSQGRIIFNKNDNVYGKTDIKVFRLYSKGFNAEEVLNNYHSCIKDINIRNEEVTKNNMSTSAALTEIYFIKNPNGSINESGTNNSTFALINNITSKSASKTELVNSTVIIRRYTDNSYTSYTDEVYTNVDIGLQGTSTLAYPVKNYRINLYKNDVKGKKLRVQFTNPIDNVTWREEYRYTMKCDYMESSHMNNTGLARFINNKLYECGNVDEDISSGKRLTPVQRKYLNATNYNGYRTLIDGFPVMVFETDGPTGTGMTVEKDEYGNYMLDKSLFDVMGTYMFNLDKEAHDNLGFIEKDSDGNLVYPYAQSIEIATNFATSAGAFNSWTGENENPDTRVPYSNQVAYYQASMEARYQYEEETDDGYIAIDTNNGEIYLGQKYILTNGKYNPISDTDALNYVGTLYRQVYNEDHVCYNTMARLLNFVDKSTDTIFKNYIHKHLNLSFAIDYYIMVMIMGMVDNFGKNMMLSTWNLNENGIHIDPKYIDPTYNPDDYVPDSQGNIAATNCVQWYPTFYDMDTCAGLNNYGEEKIDVNAEIPLDKLSGYIYQNSWDPASNHPDYVARPLKYNDTDDDIILDSNGELLPEYELICDEEYYILRDYVTHSNIANSTAYPNYYMYPRDLIRKLAVLTMNTSLQQDATIIAMTSELETLNVELKNNSAYKYYWQVSINTRDADGNPIVSATVGNDIFDGTTWLEFNCATYTVSKSTNDTERFRFYNTANSRLWSRLGTLFQQEIYSRYNVLRSNKVLDVDTIMNFLEDFSSGRIPKSYFNVNAIFKYLKLGVEKFATYGHMCNGDRRVTLRKWLTERFKFIDTVLYDPKSYLPTSVSDMYASIDNKPSIQQKTELLVKTHSPCYITIMRDQGANVQRKYVSPDIITYKTSGTITEEKDGQLYEIETAQNSAIYIYGIKNISTINSLKNLLLKETVELQYADKLLSIDLQNNNTITGLNAILSDEYYFNKLDLSNCKNITSLNLSKMIYLEELNLSNCTALTNLTLPTNGRLKKVILTNCSSLKQLICNNLFQLETLDIDGCELLNEISFIGCQKITSLNLSGTSVSICRVQSCNELTSLILTGKTINDIVISGCKKLSTLNLSSNSFSNYTLRLNAMTALKSLNVSGSSGLTRIILPNKEEDGTTNWGSNFKTLNIYNCSDLNEITYNDGLGNTTTNVGVFDFTLCTGLTSLSAFRGTNVVNVKNLVYTNCPSGMFYEATLLTTLTGCTLKNDTLTTVLQQFFRNTKISTFTNCTFSFKNATSLNLTFYACKELTKSVVGKIINSTVCPKITSASRTFHRASFSTSGTNRELDTAWFNNLPITNFEFTFASTNITKITNANLLKSSATTNVSCKGTFYSCTSLTTVSRDLVANNKLINNTIAMFYNCYNLTSVINIYKNTAIKNTSYMFKGCSAIKATMNLINSDIKAMTAGEITVPSEPDANGSDAGYGNFLYMSTYYLTNLTQCIEMYAGMSNLKGTNVWVGDLETGHTESCIPNNYFANNTVLTDISGLFRSCSAISTQLPACFFNENNTTNITLACAVFAFTNIIGEVGENFFKGAEKVTTLSGMTSSFGGNIESLSQLRNNYGSYSVSGSQKLLMFETTYLTPTNYSFFFNTSISGYHDRCLWPLTELTDAAYLFAKRSSLSDMNSENDTSFLGATTITSSEYTDEDTRCCISPNTFIKNTKLSNISGCFFGQLGLTGIPSHNLFKKNTNLYNVSSLFLGCYNLGSNTGSSATSGDGSPAKMIDFSNCKIGYYHATFANCSKYVVSLLSDDNLKYYPLDNTFKENSPYDISFMFNECPVLIDFSEDELFNSNEITYTQYAFNQAYTTAKDSNGNYSVIINTYESDSGKYFGITPATYTGYLPADRQCYSTISGKIPKYLFKNKTSLINASYMFAGTGVSGWIPSTMFDIDNNYNPIEVTHEYYYVDNKTYDNEHVFYYKNDDGKMVEYSNDVTDTVQKYSLGSITYTDKELKQESVRTYYNKLKSLAGMFAYCSNLGHSGTGTSSFRGAMLYDSLNFNGYIKDDNGDYVLDDNTYKFRKYNSETDDYNTTDNVYSSDYDIKDDGTKQRYSQYNQCMLLDSAYEYNSIDKSFTVNLANVYFIHPNTFQFIVQNTGVKISLTGFTRDCIRLQGVISENMLNNMKNITSTASMFYNCVNLYGTTTNEINHILDNQLQYLENISYMFYNCISLNRLSSVSCILTEATKNTSGYYVDGFISTRKTNNLNIFYPGQNTLTNIVGLFHSCKNLSGIVKYDQFINSTKHKKLTHSNNCCLAAFYDTPQLTKSGIPSESPMLRVQ